MNAHAGRTLIILVVAAAAVLGAIGVVGVVAPEAQPAILAIGVVAYLISIPLGYVYQRHLHW
jgi:hypothetical protein